MNETKTLHRPYMHKIFELIRLGMRAILGVGEREYRASQSYRDSVLERAKNSSDYEQVAEDWANICGDMHRAYNQAKKYYGIESPH